MSKNLLIFFGVFVAVVVAGFFIIKGVKPKSSTPSPIPASSQVVANAPLKEFSVTAKEYSFTPSTITVNKGDNVKITFKNGGTTAHNFTITDLGIASNTISPGNMDTVSFNVPNSGSYTYFCSIDGHRGFGMQGTLIVN